MTSNGNDRSNIRTITLSEAEHLWSNLLTDDAIMPYYSVEWYRSWIEIHGKEWQPYLLLINETTIAPFVRQDSTVEFIHLYSDFNDLIGIINDNVWEKILHYLKQNGIKKMVIEQIPENSETVAFFQQYAHDNKNCSVTPAKTAPILKLPDTFEKYLSTIKNKRRKYHKFQKEFPNTVSIKSETPENDIDIITSLMETDAVKEMNSDKIAFFKKITLLCKKHIWMQLLKLNDEVIAGLFMFIHNKKVMLYISGFEKEKYPNIGTYLIIDAIRQAIDQKYTEFSFLKGREQYKYELGAVDSALYTVIVDF